jgi:type I restriction enzyme S subunit
MKTETTEFGKVVKNLDSKRIPLSSRERSLRHGTYPYYGAAGIIDYVDGAIFSGLHLLIGEDGSVVRENGTPYVQLADGEFWVNNHAHVVKGERDNDTKFIYYVLKQTNISSLVTGAVQPKITQGNLNSLVIPFPPAPKRDHIVNVLGTLDDKIEMNRRMSATLEEMARALFKSWFIDFDPVHAKAQGRPTNLPPEIEALFPDAFEDSKLGPIPKGWAVSCIGKVAHVVDCLHSKKPERRDSGLPLLQLSNICKNGLIDLKDTYYVDEADYNKWTSRIEASPGDCVITNVGRVGAVAQMPKGLKAALGRNMTAIRCKSDFPFPTFLIECLTSEGMRHEIARKMDTGTILDALNVRNIPLLRFVCPVDPKILKLFESQMKPLRGRMEHLHAESRTLGDLRDVLLPKLISGGLNVLTNSEEISDGSY